ncbi:hypothetical protein IEN85_18780 [Pelagicoccus sp. NFK12]|uniref:Uncharacterized protein n=2 Tax=Pelagicoccus enzymogenes TaxID=2773457 RepID=A0A927FB04_9BACT|nr:hypothetical protein [Pelagicoccus enzymogenes]MBD5779478.1 hypothetical protein [Pelagicoccus enzymogenes]MBD5779966.1 hypothetical protein [Pelagicoccus enzymogenes]MBD5781554.1 hypothetical protein [Pelagicoccus enzymogenes]
MNTPLILVLSVFLAVIPAAICERSIIGKWTYHVDQGEGIEVKGFIVYEMDKSFYEEMTLTKNGEVMDLLRMKGTWFVDGLDLTTKFTSPDRPDGAEIKNEYTIIEINEEHMRYVDKERPRAEYKQYRSTK